MNSLQISNILNNYRRLRGIFIGVFASDNIRIPPTATYPLCFVANTERQGTAGEHWIACWASSRERVEYFDSFGDPPPPAIEHKLRAHFPVKKTNFACSLCCRMRAVPIALHFWRFAYVVGASVD
jgi:hypothetical protein